MQSPSDPRTLASRWAQGAAIVVVGMAVIHCGSSSTEDSSTALGADLSRCGWHGCTRPGAAPSSGAAAPPASPAAPASPPPASTPPASAPASTPPANTNTNGTTSSAGAPSPSDGIATIQIKNNCSYSIDVGGSPSSTFFTASAPTTTLAPGASLNDNLGPDSNGYPTLFYQAQRTGTNPGGGNYSLAELTLNANGAQDFYDLSLVNAFNLPLSLTPLNEAACPAPSCAPNLLSQCPAGKTISENGQVISCSKMGDRDSASDPAAVLFHAQCPDAYSWSGDNLGTKACNGQDYLVTFCP